VKLRKVTIEGFRGVPKTLELELDGKSLCLLGENGRGKTTIVDALEYWSRGKIESFSREGYGIDAAINLDHGGPAVITCERPGHATLRRRLTGSKAEELELASPSSLDSSLPPELPVLRHSTMAHFMAETPGEKKRALLTVLGLEYLLDFRDALVTAANAAGKSADEAERRVQEEQRTLEDARNGLGTVERAEALRKEAQLGSPIASEDDLLDLDLATTPAVQARVDRAELVEQVARSLARLRPESVKTWNEICSSREAAAADALLALISTGQKVLETWDEETCPLCLSAADTAKLSASLAKRAASLADLDEQLRSVRTDFASHRDAVQGLADAIDNLLGSPPKNGWPEDAALGEASRWLRSHAREASTALTDHRPCEAPRDLDLSEILPRLREAAIATPESPTAAALAQLERLRIAFQRVRECQRKAKAKRKVANAVDGLREVAENEMRTAVEGAIAKLSEVAADYYGRLVKNPVYSDVALNYTEGRRGGIEFSLVFDKRHKVTPPQRVVSESQLNALGLAFFLARLKVEDTPWRTLVLDEVVNSFDADHRMGLARLLNEEFGSWQVLFFTHDNMFATLSERFFTGWRFWQIVGWTPKEGPILSEGDPLKRLEARLDAGEAAIDLGGLARFALERALSRPLERLGLPIRFDRRSLYSAPEYLDALQKGLADRGSPLKDMPVLARMKGESYLVNVGAHDRQADPSLSTEDLRQMVTDLRELERAFICPDCQRPVWETRKGFDSFQCACSKLAM